MTKEIEPRYGYPGEDGFWPDEPGSIEPEVYGPHPVIVKGNPFEAKSQTMTLNGKTVELPAQLRQTVKVAEQGIDGEFHERPARTDELNSLKTVSPESIDTSVSDPLHPTYQKSSRKILNLPE